MLRRLFVGALWLFGLGLAAGIALVVFGLRLRPAANPPPAATAMSSAPLLAAPAAQPIHPPGDVQTAPPPPLVAGAAPPNVTVQPGPMLPQITDCTAKGYDAATAANAASLRTLAWTPFHRPEVGWETYAPRIEQEIGLACNPDTPGFAKALSHWQKAHRLPATGILDDASFTVMNGAWELQRPFVRLSATGVCPAAPTGSAMTRVVAGEAYGGKAIQLRTEALQAYRQMVAAARADVPAIAADHHLLAIVSGYRTPAEDTARCAKDGDCGNVTRALCSAHRTGLAVDLILASGAPVSTDDANRLRLTKTPAYAWMVANAGRFGFVNYPFEPWHWEWTGAAQ
jgi:LAS superfamily LD-carboxypeptidase LdcB